MKRIFTCPLCHTRYDLKYVEGSHKVITITNKDGNKQIYCSECSIKLLMKMFTPLQHEEEEEKQVILNEEREEIISRLNLEINESDSISPHANNHILTYCDDDCISISDSIVEYVRPDFSDELNIQIGKFHVTF